MLNQSTPTLHFGRTNGQRIQLRIQTIQMQGQLLRVGRDGNALRPQLTGNACQSGIFIVPFIHS
jgi:hypothetical protein